MLWTNLRMNGPRVAPLRRPHGPPLQPLTPPFRPFAPQTERLVESNERLLDAHTGGHGFKDETLERGHHAGRGLRSSGGNKYMYNPKRHDKGRRHHGRRGQGDRKPAWGNRN